MASEQTDLKKPFADNAVYRFLGGAAFGTFMVVIPYSLDKNIEDLIECFFDGWEEKLTVCGVSSEKIRMLVGR